jgi:hypothetical protein
VYCGAKTNNHKYIAARLVHLLAMTIRSQCQPADMTYLYKESRHAEELVHAHVTKGKQRHKQYQLPIQTTSCGSLTHALNFFSRNLMSSDSFLASRSGTEAACTAMCD